MRTFLIVLFGLLLLLVVGSAHAEPRKNSITVLVGMTKTKVEPEIYEAKQIRTDSKHEADIGLLWQHRFNEYGNFSALVTHRQTVLLGFGVNF